MTLNVIFMNIINLKGGSRDPSEPPCVRAWHIIAFSGHFILNVSQLYRHPFPLNTPGETHI